MVNSPTLRRRRLSRRMRELREASGLTAKQVAADAKRRSGKPRGWSDSKVIRLEKGEWKRLRTDDVHILLDIYGVTDTAEREACAALALESNQQGWWASFDDVLGSGQFVGLEAEALRIRTYESAAIPGLLQTEDYARAMIRSGGLVEDDTLQRRVEVRMLRQQILTRRDAPTYWAIIDEAALRRVTAELADQLEHLLDVGSRANVGIQVLPFSCGPHTAMTGQFVIMDFPPPDPPAVYLEAMTEELYLEKPPQIQRYQHIYDYVQAMALSVDESRDYIRHLITSHT
ncbi:helix-turn-helix transcriptional regulator [Lipingzhangella sp. LS1_29]|uniref:Helix-turn-helix transcriptional regulator n=1 Tax=Lipingzhangella rawalii TaxID=2055835 RepID=A0ABU2H846_9ACTN|nr:helix-turn-helix transcriptional regulator [Lipingzhangella rawalii]MDS1271483.1 helix-turn-helix transcriptional regulator [Lipingzhangella rawalii]